MSKLIRQLLGEKDPLFTVGLTRLEAAAGKPAIDVALIAEIQSTARAKIAELGLDPLDTHGKELYAALREKASSGDAALRSYLGHPASSDAASDAIVRLVSDVVGEKTTWSIKHTAIKTLFKSNPPKKVMKAFHYQSLDSFVRRMDMSEAMLAARLVEGPQWWAKTKKLLACLTSKDFGASKLELIQLTSPTWLPLLSTVAKEKGYTVIGSKECGAIGLYSQVDSLSVLSTTLHVLQMVNEVVLHGTFLKLHYVSPTIGNALVHAIDEGGLIHGSLSGVAIHWRDVQRYFGSLAADGDVYFSHLDTNDLGWVAMETRLALLVPDLAFWVGTDFIGVSYGDNKQVSCNLVDVVTNVVQDNDHKSAGNRWLKRALRSELMARYAAHPVTRALLLKQFDLSSDIDQNW
jgi:hypothetical protein